MFKPGDIIRLKSPEERKEVSSLPNYLIEMAANAGATAVIKDFTNSVIIGEVMVLIKWLSDQNDQEDGSYFISHFTLVTTSEMQQLELPL